MNNNIEFENEDPKPNEISPRTNYGEGWEEEIFHTEKDKQSKIMKKYKLINNKTKEKTICDKVILEDGFDYYIEDREPTAAHSILSNCYYIFNNTLYKREYSHHKSCKLVLCTNNPSIPIPKVINEVEMWIDETVSYLKDEHTIKVSKMCLKAGYNKSQKTHPFSEEDVKEIFKIAQTQKNYGDYKPYTYEEAIQLWKEQQSKIVYYESN